MLYKTLIPRAEVPHPENPCGFRPSMDNIYFWLSVCVTQCVHTLIYVEAAEIGWIIENEEIL